ncbi:hypothetical protein Patl1_21163 [Pistacia atlantica]|uniref:Uncharacterized protein n=1 Tax=Pistacia atlantica TaxID=434234 RepID=A0ACC1BJA6_9ROSI|nr:hypothetical protein Patl1_21163 [Pistacia atlantica]
MEGNSAVNLMLTKDTAVSSGNERVDDAKVDEHGVEGVLNGDEEVEPPHVGMVFSSQEEVRNYYIKYAQRQGFGIMRRSSRCGDDGKLTYFILACAQSGKTRSIANKKVHFRQMPKTNCKAKINVVVDPDGQIHVCSVVLEHNHDLSPGTLQRNIQKKSGGSRMKKRQEAKEQARKVMHQDSQSIDGEHWSIDTIPSVTAAVQDSLRHVLAKRAVEMVKSGMVIGLGSGSTLSLAIEELGKLIREGKLKDIVAVGANHQSRFIARQFGMTTVDLNDANDIDIVFDECRGAVHTVQKVIYSMAKACMILAEDTKVVHRLGSSIPVVVEVLPIALSPVLRRLVALGGVPEIRSAVMKDGPVITDLGNVVVDVSFPNGIQNPFELEKNLNMIPGVVDNGIVTGVATVVLVAAVKDGCNVKVMDLEEFIELVKGRRDANSTT